MGNREGPKPLPDDAIETLLLVTAKENKELLNDVMDNLRQSMQVQAEAGNPEIFAYGNLKQYLTSDEVGYAKLISLLCAALWELA